MEILTIIDLNKEVALASHKNRVIDFGLRYEKKPKKF